jgi:RND family efflux transporter MFP subunit
MNGKRMLAWGMLAVAAAAMVACGGKNGKEAQGRMVAAAPATLRDAVRFSGSVEPVVQVDLKAEISGRILSLPVEEGAKVRKGVVIAQLDPEPYQLKVDRALLALDRAKLVLSTADRDLQRSKALLSTGTVSKDAVEDLETARRKAELDLRDASLQLREAKKDLASAQIRAPMDGQLIALDVEEGEMVASAEAASGGTTMGVVADPSRMKVEVEVGELDYPRLKPGMRVWVSSGASDGGGRVQGRVTFISSSARASSSSSSVQVFPVEITLDADSASRAPRGAMSESVGQRPRPDHGASRDPGRSGKKGGRDSSAAKAGKERGPRGGGLDLVAGMTVAVDFVFMEREVPVAVPSSAIQKGKGPEGSTVMVKGPDGKVVSRAVRVGATDYRNTEILEGLVAGDSVLVQDVQASAPKFGPGGR